MLHQSPTGNSRTTVVLTPGRHALVLGGVAALLAALSGCVNPPLCAGVGVTSDVGVYFVRDGYDDLTGATWELCARGSCAGAELRQEGITKVNVLLPDDVAAGTASVRFRVTREGAATPVIDESVAVKLRHASDGCGGGAYSRELTYTKETGLKPDVPKEVWTAWRDQLG